MAENKAALEAEAKENNEIEFEFGGKTYVVDKNPDNWSIETMLAFEEGKSIGVVQAMLGPQQWTKFMATRPTNKTFGEFTEKLFGALGISEGE